MAAETLDPRVARTRQRVLAAALQVLRDDGWEALTHARVADVSGVGRATVYRHWPQVTSLLHDALAEAEVKVHITPTGTTRADLVGELTTFQRAIDDDELGKVIAALIDRAEWDGELAQMRGVLCSSGSAVVREIIGNARRQGDLPRRGDDELVIAQLIGPLVFRRFLSGQPITRRFIEQVVDGVLAAHRP